MKKKLLTLLFGIIGFTTTFASFPLTENLSAIEVLENENTTIESPAEDTPYGNWSLILGLAYLPLFIIGALAASGRQEIAGGVIMIAGLASFIGSIVTGFISLSRKETPKWKAIAGLVLTLGAIVLMIVSSLSLGGI